MIKWHKPCFSFSSRVHLKFFAFAIYGIEFCYTVQQGEVKKKKAVVISVSFPSLQQGPCQDNLVTKTLSWPFSLELGSQLSFKFTPSAVSRENSQQSSLFGQQFPLIGQQFPVWLIILVWSAALPVWSMFSPVQGMKRPCFTPFTF